MNRDEEFDEGSVEDGESRLRRFARRIVDRKELAEDTRDLLSGMLATSDKAKSEFVKMLGREVGHYLEGLNLKNDLLDIATNYKLEVNASFHLSPVKPKREASSSDPETNDAEPSEE